jgi:hypothetical protein
VLSLKAQLSLIRYLYLHSSNKVEMDEENKLIDEDKVKNPNCHYSESLSKSLSNINGKSVSETVRNVQRLCPGKKPVSIISSRTVTDGNDHNDDFSMSKFGFPGFSGMFGQSNDSISGIDSFLKDFGFGSLDQIEGAIIRNQPPHRNGVIVPPHHRQQQGATDQQLEEMFGNNGDRFRGTIAGPAEDI